MTLIMQDKPGTRQPTESLQQAVLRGVVFDIDGTLAETERSGHLFAFNQAFDELGLGWHWTDADYARLLTVTGGYERIRQYQRERERNGHDAAPMVGCSDGLARRLHHRKNEIYEQVVDAGIIAARPGVVRLVRECKAAGLKLAVATTTSEENAHALIRTLLGNSGGEPVFDAVITAQQAPVKKPDPLAYRMAASALGLPCSELVAIEDSPNGLAAAVAAGIPTLVTPSHFFPDDGHCFSAAACVVSHLDALVRLDGTRFDGVSVPALQRLLACSQG